MLPRSGGNIFIVAIKLYPKVRVYLICVPAEWTMISFFSAGHSALLGGFSVVVIFTHSALQFMLLVVWPCQHGIYTGCVQDITANIVFRRHICIIARSLFVAVSADSDGHLRRINSKRRFPRMYTGGTHTGSARHLFLKVRGSLQCIAAFWRRIAAEV